MEMPLPRDTENSDNVSSLGRFSRGEVRSLFAAEREVRTRLPVAASCTSQEFWEGLAHFLPRPIDLGQRSNPAWERFRELIESVPVELKYSVQEGQVEWLTKLVVKGEFHGIVAAFVLT